MATKETGIDLTPNMNRFKNAWGGLWKGAAGGVLSGLGMPVLGAPIGTVAGGFVASAIIGGEEGKTIAVISGFEAGQSIFTGQAK
jgi:hypothetical protein